MLVAIVAYLNTCYDSLAVSSLAVLLRRTMAFILDSMILILAGFYSMELLGFLLVTVCHWPNYHIVVVLKPLHFIVTFFQRMLYSVLLEAGGSQATLGKMICGLKVSGLNNERLSYSQAFIRFIVKEFTIMTYGFGLLTSLVRSKQQTLYDWAAGSTVHNR